MCGIAGVISSTITVDDLSHVLRHMTHSMRHRGPDGSGLHLERPCGLAHTRLAIIDTSATGSQPMTREGVTLVYNGELYNFQEKRASLETDGITFLGHCDAEVLLALYIRYGVHCVEHLQGMYAFAIWDSREKMLFCARDPLGIKPFLFAMTSKGFVFASELKAILASDMVSRNVNHNALRTLLERGSVTQPENILREVNWLLPGHSLKLRLGESPDINCFRSLRVGTIDLKGADWPTIVDLCETNLRNVLRRQVVSDVPLGAFLSGGIDSSLLVALMAREQSNLKTFSVGFESGLETDSEDESDDAAMIARHLGVSHTRVVVHRDEIAFNLRTIAQALDHPTVDGVNSWFVSKIASQELKVAISGTGGDELFAGYPWFEAMQNFARRSWVRRTVSCFCGETFSRTFDAQYRIFDSNTATMLSPETQRPIPRDDPLFNAETLSRVTGLVLSGYTRDQLLADIDTAAMSHGLEVRVPFLDENLLDFALSLPENAKIGFSNPLAPLGSYAASGAKRLLLEIGSPLLPHGFAWRKKRGFILPFDAWLRSILFSEMQDILSVDTTTRRGFFNPVIVQNVMEAFLAKKVHWTQPWLLIMTELWAQEILDA